MSFEEAGRGVVVRRRRRPWRISARCCSRKPSMVMSTESMALLPQVAEIGDLQFGTGAGRPRAGRGRRQAARAASEGLNFTAGSCLRDPAIYTRRRPARVQGAAELSAHREMHRAVEPRSLGARGSSSKLVETPGRPGPGSCPPGSCVPSASMPVQITREGLARIGLEGELRGHLREGHVRRDQRQRTCVAAWFEHVGSRRSARRETAACCADWSD